VVSDLIFYQFSRSKVEQGNFSHFLSLYVPEKLPTGRRLRAMMGSMVFCIEGYDDDPREIHAIPEVRRFYSAFHQAWPYWLYFCDLGQDGLRMMVFCCLDSFAAMKVDGKPNCVVECDPTSLAQFIGQDFAPMIALCERAQIFESLIDERTQKVFDYFGLPLNAQPSA